jgi:hypothetical protein
MIFTRASLISVILSALSAKAAYFFPVDSSEIVQCDTIELSYKGRAPFVVSVFDGCSEDSETDVPKAQYHTNLTTVNWKVNIAAGSSIMFGIEDAKGDWDWTDDYTVHDSDDKSCVGVKPSFSSPGSENPTSPTPTPTPTTTPLPGNAGGLPTTTTTTAANHLGGIGGALPSFSPRVGLAGFLVVGTSLASLFF